MVESSTLSTAEVLGPELQLYSPRLHHHRASSLSQERPTGERPSTLQHNTIRPCLERNLHRGYESWNSAWRPMHIEVCYKLLSGG